MIMIIIALYIIMIIINDYDNHAIIIDSIITIILD